MTPYQTKFLAHFLSLSGQAEDTISRSISSARVDMNPHQVEAALFALRSPLSRGSILADEVGLGKTIEASLVIAQRWAEKRRNILLVVPASLRKQWSQELADKFSLPSEIIEAKNYNQAKKLGTLNPFESKGKILIVSYQFAAKKSVDIKSVNWDLVIFDEAHKLRNIYKKEGSKTAKVLCGAVSQWQKVLLSATPLQNSLMELYGLVTVIDPNFFGSEAAFKVQYVQGVDEVNLQILKKRLEKLCTRTLRREIVAEGGIRFTQRHSLTQDFTPSDNEYRLYELVSEYLQRDDIAAIKSGARHLVNLVIRKILASSSFAIGDTLKKMIDRLEDELQEGTSATVGMEELSDYEAVDETAEELDSEEEDSVPATEKSIRADALRQEIVDLQEFRALAQGIKENAKGEALIQALSRAFEKVAELGGQRKAVIFTESVRTQLYLKELLCANGYDRNVVLMNGSNTDPDSQTTYREWLARHKGRDVVSGSKSADTKAAIVEAFRDRAEILIATESGAEGINLQFCSLVINYDLPWNPQRVEQRIGRCHRYGQQCDVVVVNFINKKNLADERVFELLNEKFKLFDGVFGASDEILGAIESGVDIEQRILSVYQDCRTTEQIEECFKKLEEELSERLEVRDGQARQILLENFDESVTARLRSRRETIQDSLNQFEQNLIRLVRAELPEAEFMGQKAFQYQGQIYSLDWKEAQTNNWNFFRLGDDSLAEQIVDQAKERQLETATIRFDYEQYGAQLSDLLPYRQRSGWLRATKVTVSSLQETEHLMLVAMTDEGDHLDEQQAQRLLLIPAQVMEEGIDGVPEQALLKLLESGLKRRLVETETQDKLFFDEESDKLDAWAEEAKQGVQAEIDAFEKEIKAAKKQLRALETLEQKATEKRRIKQLEKQRDDRMMAFFETRRQVEEQQEKFLDEIEAKMQVETVCQPLFTIRWQLV